jgi:hypothetical protein
VGNERESEFIIGPMMLNHDDAAPIPLARRPSGIEIFRVEGRLDRKPVHARWDGRWLIATKLLCERVELAMAVDEAFAEAGIGARLESERLHPGPEQLLLALVTCCDEIDLAEYEVYGRRRVIAPNA